MSTVRVELAADGDCTPDDAVSRRIDLEVVHGVARVRVRDLDDETRRWLSHTAGLRSEVAEPLPERVPGALVVRELGLLGRR